ncbi:uncharacterized protein BO97DRAFT_425424 [Aspergillus homomorphus CBS 101889]|uniref:Uncharacterized protein n=1 Tax=Aspergillus homomorphus (strain CBS 101889) TaxID=1450537 RepID=A0A395HVI2_ASPHC|nr:hypothetical protein BO97DRAFT_425424 [Aspergillus homomorphus CBS 101889]RAL11423.1 hypothetical protein BO97DRAFT_425424 [Aspergillus homomorphus CBS 101889]
MPPKLETLIVKGEVSMVEPNEVGSLTFDHSNTSPKAINALGTRNLNWYKSVAVVMATQHCAVIAHIPSDSPDDRLISNGLKAFIDKCRATVPADDRWPRHFAIINPVEDTDSDITNFRRDRIVAFLADHHQPGDLKPKVFNYVVSMEYDWTKALVFVDARTPGKVTIFVEDQDAITFYSTS